MRELSKIDANLENEIVKLVEAGNEAHDNNNFEEALTYYQKAWDLIPSKKTEWEISNWLAACFFSVYFDINDYLSAKKWAELSMLTRGSDIDTAPLVDLGMVCFELKEFEDSYKYFDEAYKYGKKRAFQDRPRKYLDFYIEKLKSKLN